MRFITSMFSTISNYIRQQFFAQTIPNDRNEIYLQTFLESLTDEQQVAVVTQPGRDGKNLLQEIVYMAATTTEYDVVFFHCILSSLSQSALRQALEKNVDSICSLFQLILSKGNVQLISALLSLLPEEDYLALLKSKDANGKSSLHRAANARSYVTFKLIFTSMPEIDRLPALYMTAACDKSVLDIVFSRKKLRYITSILESLPEADRLLLIKSYNLLFKVMDENLSPEWLSEIMNTVPADKQFAVICEPHSECQRNLLITATYSHQFKIQYIQALIKICTASERLEVLSGEVIANIVTWYPHEFIMNLLRDFTSEELLKLFSLDSKCGNTVLHTAVQHDDPKVFASLLMLLPEKQRQALIENLDWNGDTLLRATARVGNLQLIPQLLHLQAKSQLEDVICHHGSKDGDTLLHLLAKRADPTLFSLLLNNLDEDQRVEALMARNRNGDTLLHIAARLGNCEFLARLIKLYPEEELTTYFDTANVNGESVFHIVAEKGDRASISMLLSGDTETDRSDLLKMKRADGNTMFHLAANNRKSEVLAYLLHNHPSAANEVIKACDEDMLGPFGNTVLHIAVGNYAATHETIEALLLIFPEACQIKNQFGNTPLHLAAQYGADTSIELLALRSTNKILQFQYLTQVNSQGETVFHVLCDRYRDGKIICTLSHELGVNRHFAHVISMQDKKGKTVLHRAIERPRWSHAETVIRLLSTDDLLAVIRIKDDEGYTVLSRLVWNQSIDLLSTLFRKLPSGKHREAVEASDVNGTPLLLKAIASTLYDTVKDILNLYPEDQQLEQLQYRYSNTHTVLHVAAFHADLKLFCFVLAKYPDTERLHALRLTGRNNMTVLQLIKEDGNTSILLDGILQLLPIQDHAAVMNDLFGQLSPTSVRHSIFGGHLLATSDVMISSAQATP